ncbi:pseudouridine synthase [Chlorobaculum limnaeum]|jgi:23S rRNA pseudouridine2605 synthase/16S rRNA pseudouridine516 synthase|uniref:Pseudouridine synthase n=1 Tax=Chlorobaculum limnaeum TaxID=274537 RepID=A0A1D8CZA3_CHLLM|nr:pseudouridine synthase [Chlorobaculum limnaeum]AOS84256.1 pseudouridine synthase [Chlorobaculum limnaeum]
MKKQAQEEKVRINKFLAMCGVASRRAADQMVLEGRVTVNGQLIVEPGSRVDPRKDEVIVDGKRMAEPESKQVYILFNKPRNVITTSHDERDRQQILDFIDVPERVFPVGRLDRKTTGLLLLTNDGTLAHLLMHPSSQVQKEYLASLDEKFPPAMLQKLTSGMRLKDTGEKVSPCRAKILDDGMSVLVGIHEGKNHQVRRMFSTLGFEVKRLDRVAYAGLTPGELRRGEWRFLSRKEVEKLYRLCRGQ